MNSINSAVFPSKYVELADRIISKKRKANLDEAITEQERQEIIIDALNVYEKVYDLFQEKSPNANTKFLIEYKQGLTKMTEEVKLPL